MEAQRVLLDHLEPPLFQQRERRGMRHVGMQHARGMRVGDMDARVDAERRLLVLALPCEHAALGVEREQVRGAHLAPVQSIGVQQEPLSIRQHHAEMVADALVQIQPHGKAERRGQIDARRLFQRSGVEFAEASHGDDYPRNEKGARRRLLCAAKRL